MIAAIGVVYFLVVGLIGGWAAYRTRTSEDFFAAGRGLGLLGLTFGSMSANLSGFAFIGGPGLVYSLGLGAVFIVLSASLTQAMGAWILARRLQRLSRDRPIFTVPEAIRVRFGSPLAQGLAATAILVAVVGYTATNVLALGIVIQTIFDLPFAASLWLGTAAVLAYTASGGILAGIRVDLFQGSLMALASLLVFSFVLEQGGGLAEISRTILAHEPGFLEPWGTIGPMAAISFFLVFGVGSLGQPHIVHKFYMLRDPDRLRWYPLLVTVAVLLGTLLFVGVGIGVKARVLSGAMEPLATPDEATPRMLLTAPTLLAGLVFSSVAAAIMSTVNAFLNVGAAALVRDLPAAFGRPLARELRWGRVATVALSVAAALTAQFSNQLVSFLGIFGWGLFASTLVPSLAVGLNWEGATRQGAVASILCGLTATLLLETLRFTGVMQPPPGASVPALALLLSLGVMLVVSAWTQGRPENEGADPDRALSPGAPAP